MPGRLDAINLILHQLLLSTLALATKFGTRLEDVTHAHPTHTQTPLDHSVDTPTSINQPAMAVLVTHTPETDIHTMTTTDTSNTISRPESKRSQSAVPTRCTQLTLGPVLHAQKAVHQTPTRQLALHLKGTELEWSTVV